MPGAATAEAIFIAAMMVLILIISFAAVFFFFRTYKKEMSRKERDKEQSKSKIRDPKSTNAPSKNT
ncbi:MAG TPA: hypothetical protein VJ781_08635 [Pyrinomonadaceae bacterium]|jgi:Na+/melibiose symporter-like transporter|nr:hypothetical protein [Pyrinomonadaceae bacterium]